MSTPEEVELYEAIRRACDMETARISRNHYDTWLMGSAPLGLNLKGYPCYLMIHDGFRTHQFPKAKWKDFQAMAFIIIGVLGAEFGSVERTVCDRKNFVYTVWIRTHDKITRQVFISMERMCFRQYKLFVYDTLLNFRHARNFIMAVKAWGIAKNVMSADLVDDGRIPEAVITLVAASHIRTWRGKLSFATFFTILRDLGTEATRSFVPGRGGFSPRRGGHDDFIHVSYPCDNLFNAAGSIKRDMWESAILPEIMSALTTSENYEDSRNDPVLRGTQIRLLCGC